MTIVESQDTRNADWTKHTSNVGSRLLEKMGWSEGQGLGKRRQGSTVALRAVRRAENLGIGASSTATEQVAWKQGNDFSSVLSSLQQEHNTSDNEKKKKKKRRKDNKNSLTLAKNKVTAGHAQKMRDSKDLTTKTDKEMQAIFGTSITSNDEEKKAKSKKNSSSTKKRKATTEETKEEEQTSLPLEGSTKKKCKKKKSKE